MTVTVAQALTGAALDAVDARVLLRHALGVEAAWLVAHDRDALTPAQLERYAALVARRRAGEPVAYLTGEREFFGLSLSITPAVLIPRPETELLVEWALETIGAEARAHFLDLGTGSGCIAIALAHARPEARGMAVDCSGDALAVANANAQRCLNVAASINTDSVANLSFLQSDWFSEMGDRRFDLIVSNPPYIATGDAHLAQGDLRFEPVGALASGRDGLDAIGQIVAAAPRYLQPGGWLAFEHGYDQAQACRTQLQTAGFTKIFSRTDFAGIERISGGRLDGGGHRS